MWGGGGRTGPKAVPGNFQVRMKTGDWSQTQPLHVAKDPRGNTTQAEFEEQFALAGKIGEKIKELYDSILKIRDVKKQSSDLAERLERAGHGKDATQAAKALSEKLARIEGELTQLQGEGGQDALNFPGRLDNQFVILYNEVAGPDGAPTAGSSMRFEDLKPKYSELLGQLKQVLDTDVANFNQLIRSKGVPPVILLKEASPK